jgi:hypothetical protein
MGKKEWVKTHWWQVSKKFGHEVGEFPHHPSYQGLGWNWTPKLCLCDSPCYLRTDSQTMKGKS